MSAVFYWNRLEAQGLTTAAFYLSEAEANGSEERGPAALSERTHQVWARGQEARVQVNQHQLHCGVLLGPNGLIINFFPDTF